jgi:alpha-2-macroglobulin
LLNRNNNSLIYYVYARSFWQKQNPLTDSLKQNIRTFLFNEWKSGENKPLYDQSLLIIASFRFANRADELITQATKQINSIRQLAIKDEQNGMRWKELADADNLNISSEETSALLAEAFQESESNDTIQNEILKWLLTAKNEHSWGSTKATAAAINLLYKKDESAIGETQTIALSVGNKKTIVNDDLLKGSSYSFLPINLLPSSIYLKKENPGIASGNFIWYYFTTGSLLNNVNKDIQITKTFYKWDRKENKWNLISDNTDLNIADRVKVILTVQSSKSLPFVFIDDKRAAAFEPADNGSGYEFGSGFSYYKSVKDVSFLCRKYSFG